MEGAQVQQGGVGWLPDEAGTEKEEQCRDAEAPAVLRTEK